MLTTESLNDLSDILHTEFDQNLTPEEVFAVGQRLVGMFDHLMKLDFEDKNNNEKTDTRNG
ncbi:MAG: hypothetical protein WCP09_00580 [Candidatus Taylorbacteria bacterium]